MMLFSRKPYGREANNMSRNNGDFLDLRQDGGHRTAFGAPGLLPGWTSSAKDGIGTAYHTSCRVWFTLSHGIVNEIYYPNVDQPNTRDFQFLITDGETFCHEEKRDLTHESSIRNETLFFIGLRTRSREAGIVW
jgi:hypothetical protein